MKKKIFNVIVVVLIVIISIQTNMYIVMAESSSDLQNQKNETNDKIKQTEKELEGVKEEKSETMKQVEELSSKISDYEEQIARVE